ncbi:hypothetical protein [Inhella proteolytica]|uniref:Transmembrane protein n=1 Tax=Inhella proteolytica TaxID=2795029 RepID=A0A931J699_9BURK|nr:hypothetical protein [Inhella proteolytica]MBH9579010.1 hypothetical protein [Inhella proteolytica]
MASQGRGPWRWLLRPFIGLLALLLLAEEWLWDALQRGMRRLGLALHLQRLEACLRKLPPWPSLLLLAAPAALLLPFKLAALWALAHGYKVLGLLVFVAAKLCGTALAAYLFDLVRDSARRLRWFDRFYGWVMGWLARARAWLHAQAAYQQARASAREFKQRLRQALARRRPAAWLRWWRSARARRHRSG